MKKENLGELCEIVMGRTPARDTPEYWGKGYPWVSIGDLKQKYLKHTKEEITQTAVENVRCRLIPKGTLLFSFKLSIGKMAFASCDLYTNEAIAGLLIKDSQKLSPEYLFYALKATRFLGSNQAAMGKTLNSKSLDIIKIPLPDKLTDQIRIATLLSRVEALIATRKDNLRLLDEFLKSTFLEMFGILHTDYKKWTPHKLSELAEIVSGATKGKKYKDEAMVEAPYMRVANVQDGHLNLDEIKTIFVSESEFKRYLLKKGDILLTEGGDPDKLGRGSVWEDEIKNCIHQNHIFRVRITNTKLLNPYFLSALAGSVYGKTYFLKAAKQTTGIASINSTQLKNFPLFLPPIESQDQFAAIVEKVESLKNHYQQNLTELENLYGALSQKAFKGELDLNRVPLAESGMEANKTEYAITEDKAETKNDLTTDFLHEFGLLEPILPSGFQHWFNDFLASHIGVFSEDNFWQEAERQMIDSMNNKDENGNPKGLESYEKVRQWLFDLISKKIGIFSLDSFWQETEGHILDSTDENIKSLDIEDYGKVKQQLFDLISSGKVSQHFNETINQIELSINA
jgi:type I restriction enzyme S subunit